MGIFDKIFQRQKDIDVRGKKPLISTELAIDETAIYKRLKLVQYSPDDLFSKKRIDIFNKMALDPEISSAIETLKIIRLSTGWDILPASDDTKDKELAEFVRYNFENIDGSFYDDLKEILGAVELGISINEIVWKVFKNGKYKNLIGLKSIKSKNPKYFNIWTDDFDNITEYGVVNISSADYGKQYPADKFIIYSFNKKYENVFGTSRIRTLYDLWFLKQVITRALGIYIEKFGHPFPVMKHPEGLDEATKNYLLNLIKQIRYESGLLLPAGIELLFSEDSGKTSTIYLDVLRWINEQIRKTILGQTLTAETQGVGSYSLGKVHYDILLFYVEQLGIDVAEKAINNQLIKRLIGYNFSGIEEYPKFQFKSLIQDDMSTIIDKYLQAVEKGIVKPIPEDETKIREILKMPKRKEVETDKSIAIKNPEAIVEKKADEFIEIKFAEKIFTGVSRKTFTEYEKVIDFAEIKQTHEIVKDKYIVKAGKIIQDGIKELIKDIQNKKIIENKNFDAIKKLIFPLTGELKEIFLNMFIDVLNFAKLQGRQEVLKKKKKTKKYSEVIKFQYEIDLRNLKDTEALEFFKAKAFDMAGIERDTITNRVKNILYNAIKSGIPLKDVVNTIQTELSDYLNTGEVEDEALKGYRLETVVRTNITEAMNEGRKIFFQDPVQEGYVVAYQYSAILDDRTTLICEELDQKIYPVNSPIIDLITPPVHYNCRSLLVPITQDEQWEESERPNKSIIEKIENFKKIST